MRAFLLILIFISNFTYGQSGYFGKRYSLDFDLFLAPTTNRTFSVRGGVGNEHLTQRLRIFYPNYRTTFSRLFGKRSEVGIFYEHAEMKSQLGLTRIKSLYSNNNRYLLNDLSIRKQQIGFNFLFYANNRIAPIGAFFGFSIGFGRSIVLDDELLQYGLVSDPMEKSNALIRKYELGKVYRTSVDTYSKKSKFLVIHGTVGKRFPLNNRLILTTALTFPLISYYPYASFNDGDNFPIPKFIAALFGYQFLFNPGIEIEDGDVKKLIQYSSFKYNSIQLRIGLHFMLF